MVSGYSTYRILSYLVCAVITTVFCGYLFFPADKIKNYVEKSVEYWSPDSSCRIGRVDLLLPLRLRFENIQIQKPSDENQSMFMVDSLEISPALKFWQGVTVKGKLFSGQFQAELLYQYQSEEFELAKIRVEDVDVEEIGKSVGSFDRTVTGRVGFLGNYEATYALPFAGTGQGTVNMTLGSLELKRPVLSLSTLNFEKVVSAVSCDKAACKLSNGEALGDEIDAVFSGELNLKAPFLTSRLQLTGSLEPQDSFFKTHPDGNKMVQQLLYITKAGVLPFTVGGTLSWPTFRFSM